METQEKLEKELIKGLRYVYYFHHTGFSQDEYKVRYGKEQEKFYLNWVEGSYESSLQLLIHKMMYNTGIYKKFLNDRCMAGVEEVIRDYPDSIYGVNEEDFTEEEEANGYTYSLIQETYLDGLQSAGIKFIAEQIQKQGFSVGDTFEQWGVEDE